MWYIINKFILLKNIVFEQLHFTIKYKFHSILKQYRKVEKINDLIIYGNMQATEEYDIADRNAVIIAWL